MHIKNPTAPCIRCYTTLQNVNVNKTSPYRQLQGSVAACLKRGEIVNNRIKKGLLLSVRVEILFKSANIWQSSRALCAPGQHAAKKTKKVHETITFLLVTLPNIYRF